VNKKKKNKKQRRLLLLFLLLIGTGVFLGTATYAWFTANKTVTVNPIDVNVAAKSGLQISADGQNWKSILTNADITGASGNYAAAINQIPNMVEPVSSVGTIDETGKMEMYLGTVTSNTSGDWILSAARTTETNSSGEASTGSFVAYDIFLKTEKDTDIYLTTNSNVVFSDAKDTGIKNSSRVAFVNLGHTTSYDTIANIQALNTHATSAVKIWEPNADVHTSYGVANARDTYNITTLTAGAGNTAVPYDGILTAFDSTKNITLINATAAANATYFKSVTPAIRTNEGFTTSQNLISLTAGVTKVRVYMWVEGQDVDCENNASGGKIAFNLQFSTEA
jgi:predicted ribosomally synthesized peptide with SipW-like signal peptide